MFQMFQLFRTLKSFDETGFKIQETAEFRGSEQFREVSGHAQADLYNEICLNNFREEVRYVCQKGLADPGYDTICRAGEG
jgi:hypothetical protein